MEIILKIVPRPTSNSYTLCDAIDKDLLRETKTVIVRADTVSKTRVSTSMQIGNSRSGINFAIDGFKTHEETDWSYFTGESQTHNYFKLLKSQGFNRYKEYVKEVVRVALTEYINTPLDKVTIELEEPHFLTR